ncbi:hypothetical protein N657DRAFT_639253 [Parathielavia appendiculata]|uniref:Wax synthase domain-containing protein n=1 Tax=Parathielavia appendiculata TaxID=2587402 RepID=A0AAN6U987_9PEZI|nr:hypothetical protein N657DRAFT_639253 [Parathielavia appendiculata]
MAVHPPGPGPDDGNFNLGAYHQQQYRETFRAALAAGKVKPLLFPWSFIGCFFLPLFYLSIPHKQRPWLYRMRWAVAATVVYLNVNLIRTTSADNEAVAYATGLMAVWGTIWSLRCLIFTRAQWDAARVERRQRRPHANGFIRGEETQKSSAMVPPDESVAIALLHSEYYWQPFPTTAPFLTRLGWTAGLLISFRGGGWNFSIPSIPHPPLPKHIISHDKLVHEPVRLDLMPLTTRAGTTRSQTYASFLRSRLKQIILSYLLIDILTTTMRQDPYFVLGPAYALHPSSPSLPGVYNHAVPGQIIPLVRNIAAIAGIVAVLHLYYALLQLAAVFILPRLLGARAELWQHPTLFGGLFCQGTVLDRGLAGFWGGFWHQTFRAGFVAPAEYLLSFVFYYPPYPQRHHQHEKKLVRSLVKVAMAFVLSGLLHAAGNYTSVTRETAAAWPSAVFFLLQGIGALVQNGACFVLRSIVKDMNRIPPWIRRAGNLVFVVCWLQMTGWALIDDMSRGGVWLFEPVPVSPLRMMGLGVPGERWWRWEGETYGWRWHWGSHWWESGLRL